MELAEETVQERERFQAELEKIRAEAETDTDEDREELYRRAVDAAGLADPDEADTRFHIDLKLCQAGWEAGSEICATAKAPDPVFVRRVKSRILYEQMLRRATRLRPDLHGRGEDKEVFHIYDLYATLKDHSDMKRDHPSRPCGSYKCAW